MSDSRDDFIIALRYSLLKKGAKQKFSLFFLIIFSITIITLDKLSIPPVNFVRSTINDLVYRITIIAAVPGNVIVYLGSKTKKHLNIYSENIALKEELDLLKKKKYEISYFKTENENLKLALGLENIKITVEDTITIANVMVDQRSPFLKSVLINKGTKHNIIKGMTVFSKNYLIGTVIETNYLSSRVLLITDLNSKIPSIIEDTDINVILAGRGNKNDFTLEYLPENFLLSANKIIFTSGKDGFLKSGMPVAETYLDKNNIVKIRSLVDPQQASIVHITKGQFKN
jgi:rod shape-determining protein MreC|tara:strand:- start:4181 stop:5038 length:858 start_codon:yes stop_codon:yes gene_type:complete